MIYLNTSGFIRGYLVKGLGIDELIMKICKWLSIEFKEVSGGVKYRKKDEEYVISMNGYTVVLNDKILENIKGNYAIDKYILDEFQKQGFEFDKNRSQYIKYCYGIYNNNQIV